MARSTRDGYSASPAFHSTLKRKYDEMFEQQYATWFPIVDFIKKKGNCRRVEAGGSKLYFGVEYRNGDGSGFVGEGDALPQADPVLSVEGSVDWNRALRGRIQLTPEAMKFSKQGKGAYIDAMKQETRGMVNSIKQKVTPALWSIGNGVIGRVNGAVSASAAVTVDSSELSTLMLPGTRWMHEGMRVDMIETLSDYTRDTTWSPEAGVSASAADRIKSIDSDTTFTLCASNTIAGDSYIIPKGCCTLGTGSSFRGPQGILAMVDDDTLSTHAGAAGYCGLLVSSYPQWKAVIKDGGGSARPLTLRLLYDLVNTMIRRNGTASPNMKGFTNYDLFQEVVDLLEHFVQFKPRKLEGGWTEATIAVGSGNVLEFERDIHCPGAFFVLDPKFITLAEANPLEVVNEDGATMPRVADYDAFEMRWRWILNLYTNKRMAHGGLFDISYDVGSVG